MWISRFGATPVGVFFGVEFNFETLARVQFILQAITSISFGGMFIACIQ